MKVQDFGLFQKDDRFSDRQRERENHGRWFMVTQISNM